MVIKSLISIGIILGMTTTPRTLAVLFDDESPELCDSAGTSADYKEVLIGSGKLMARYTESTTGCPNHVNWALNSYAARETPSGLFVPAYPVLLAKKRVVDLSTASGAVGILFNGVSTASSWTQPPTIMGVDYTPQLVDVCGGHTTDDGWYRYRNIAGCLQEQAMLAAGLSSSDHSPQLGWSYDGFPIYGQLGPHGVIMKVCGQEGANSTYCLDSCSGYEGEMPEVDDFKYRYYLISSCAPCAISSPTPTSTYRPCIGQQSCGSDGSFSHSTLNCYRGCCPTHLPCANYVEPCIFSGSTKPGYTESYTPVVHDSLAEPYDADFIVGNDTDLVGSEHSVDCSSFTPSEPSPSTDAPTPSPTGLSVFSLAPDVTTEISSTATPSAMPTSAPTSASEPSSSNDILTPSPTGFNVDRALKNEAWSVSVPSATPTSAPTSASEPSSSNDILTPSPTGFNVDRALKNEAWSVSVPSATPTSAPTSASEPSSSNDILTPSPTGFNVDRALKNEAWSVSVPSAMPTSAPTSASEPSSSDDILTPSPTGFNVDRALKNEAWSVSATPTSAPTSDVASMWT